MTSSDAASATPHSNCANCDAPLRGPYCAQCGQKDLDLDRPFLALLREWLGTLFAFDARLWRTLRPLATRPGFLTTEYLAGRRVRYVPPLRLYFFASIAMFLALAWSGYSVVHYGQGDEPVQVFTTEGLQDVEVTESQADGEPSWIDSRIETLVEQPKDVVNALYRKRLAQTLIFQALAFALFSRILFRRPHRRLFHHLVFSMHVHAAAFVGIVFVHLLGMLLDLAWDDAGKILGLLYFPILFVYVFLAMRRVHGRGRFATFWRYVLLFIAYAVTLALTLVCTLLLTAIFL